VPPALGERQRPQINAIEPDQIEGHIGGCPHSTPRRRLRTEMRWEHRIKKFLIL
jgi:hypothetical protein